MPPTQPHCVGSPSFSPSDFFERWESGTLTPPGPSNDLRTSILTNFNIPPDDTYVYHATASVTLSQVQQAISAGNQNGLHDWYSASHPNSSEPAPPSAVDIDAYTTIFASGTSTPNSLKAFAANAKKASVRAGVAQNLTQKRLFPDESIAVPKKKKGHVNPYLGFWAWSCRCLEWCGPDAGVAGVRISHHILPVFYHHFGCVVPSYEALETIRQVCAGRAVVDAGSGNGYWSYMLRRTGMEVTAVDNGDSVWRAMWVGDTIKMDAGRYLKEKGGGRDAVLLLVYPQVTTGFTTDVIGAYEGDAICVAGTQNGNGFTADVEALLGEKGVGWVKVVQTPLPSFAGKDDGFFVFRRMVVEG